MGTVTIGKPYFDALLRRAQFHTTDHDEDASLDLSNYVSISKAEHDFLTHAMREYNLLKSALFRGGLTNETLQTLLAGEYEALNENELSFVHDQDMKSPRPQRVVANPAALLHESNAFKYESTAVSNVVQPQTHVSNSHSGFNCIPESVEESLVVDDDYDEPNDSSMSRVPFHDQRTILISNLTDNTTHKDLEGIIRGGRLLDLHIRNDRTACISFVEGASEFLSYTKRNDIYLHMKRLGFRWADRQFHVPSHVSNKIASGATRNLVVRGIAGKITADQIRDHLDHIHNLVVIAISFRGGDAYISTNSIHNALFARTCMMSRTVYKGTRIEYCPDMCAEPFPQPQPKSRAMPTPRVSTKAVSLINQYALLDAGPDTESASESDSYLADGIRINGFKWANSAAA